jgi:SAM-dependent methyltransferase
MSHREQQDFVLSVKNKFQNYFKLAKVLEVGSLNINGSVRKHFVECQYVGIDVGPGRDVDEVCEGQLYTSDLKFDTVISCECFEHNPYWKETFENMISLTRLGGLVLFTCASTGRPEHGTTKSKPNDSPLTIKKEWNYYKNLTEEDFTSVINITDYFSEYEFSVNPKSCDLYFWGITK